MLTWLRSASPACTHEELDASPVYQGPAPHLYLLLTLPPHTSPRPTAQCTPQGMQSGLKINQTSRFFVIGCGWVIGVSVYPSVLDGVDPDYRCTVNLH